MSKFTLKMCSTPPHGSSNHTLFFVLLSHFSDIPLGVFPGGRKAYFQNFTYHGNRQNLNYPKTTIIIGKHKNEVMNWQKNSFAQFNAPHCSIFAVTSVCKAYGV